MKYRKAGKEEAAKRQQPNWNAKNYGEVTEREAQTRNYTWWLSRRKNKLKQTKNIYAYPFLPLQQSSLTFTHLTCIPLPTYQLCCSVCCWTSPNLNQPSLSLIFISTKRRDSSNHSQIEKREIKHEENISKYLATGWEGLIRQWSCLLRAATEDRVMEDYRRKLAKAEPGLPNWQSCPAARGWKRQLRKSFHWDHVPFCPACSERNLARAENV